MSAVAARAEADFSDGALDTWLATRPDLPRQPGPADRFAAHSGAASRFWRAGEALLGRLPARPQRSEREHALAERVKAALQAARADYLRAYAPLVYADLTDDYRRFRRVDDLVYAAAERFPGLVPTRQQVAAEYGVLLKDKDGVELAQGVFLAEVLAHPTAGAHLVHAMLRPTPEALERLPHFQRRGAADLGTVLVERRGRAGHVLMRNTRYLNAMDDTTSGPMETAVDLVLLDPAIEVGVLRGAPMEHPRYAGRGVFSSGINLTRLYAGEVAYLFYHFHDLGYANKLYRGHTGDDVRPGAPEATHEKVWIAAVEAFAIGGGCQLLLVVDRVLAEEGSYFNLPARREGIIPGAGPLRLPRLVGDRLARQGVLFDRAFYADSPEGRLLCDELVPRGGMDAAIERTVAGLLESGVVSAAANRKALRVGQEPLEQFQAFMALYAREQAACHFSPQLIRNLEQNWGAHRRVADGRQAGGTP